MANSAPFPHKVSWGCLTCNIQPLRHHLLQTTYLQRLLGHHSPLPLAPGGNRRLAWLPVTLSALQCYQLIDDPETRHIVDWTEDGAAFVVHNAQVPAATFCKLLQISSLNCLSMRGCLLLPCPGHHQWQCTSCTLHAVLCLAFCCRSSASSACTRRSTMPTFRPLCGNSTPL